MASRAAAVVGLAIVVALSAGAGPAPTARPQPLVFDRSLPEPGDVIFRRGRSVISEMVLAARKGSLYSHVGIVINGRDGPLVVHASPDPSQRAAGIVTDEPLERFLAADAASGAALYRSTTPEVASRAARAAAGFAIRRLPFDDDFDLRSADRLYCTELVWRAYLDAGLDLTAGARDDLAVPFGHGPYLLPGSLLHSRDLHEVPQFISLRIP